MKGPRLIVGFDSAWSASNRGAIAGALLADDRIAIPLEEPRPANFDEAADLIFRWRTEHHPKSTTVLIDQPTIVKNSSRQRPVEQIVCATIGARRSAMQPAHTGKEHLFGADAPIWHFLARFGGPADPFDGWGSIAVFETYPALVLTALGWTRPDHQRPSGRLPKYNPRSKKFLPDDWRDVRRRLREAFAAFQSEALIDVIASGDESRPSKCNQDCLDACICLLVGLQWASGSDVLVVGQFDTGYIVVPESPFLQEELEIRCRRIGCIPSEWIHRFRLSGR
jgi:predicted RNase H-like nuclease